MNHELPVNVTICQSVLDQKNMQTAMLSFCEMGVNYIVPVKTERMLPRHTGIDNAETVRRWRNDAKVFMRNSLRKIAPIVYEPIPFADAVAKAKNYDVVILCYENEHDSLCTAKAIAECKDAKSVLVFIGPERGFTPEEVELAKNAGAHIVSLGNRIIRACNAGAIFMGMLVYALELDGDKPPSP